MKVKTRLESGGNCGTGTSWKSSSIRSRSASTTTTSSKFLRTTSGLTSKSTKIKTPSTTRAGIHVSSTRHASTDRNASGRARCASPQDLSACRRLTRTRNRSEEHTSELQSLAYLVCRLLLEKKKINQESSPRR